MDIENMKPGTEIFNFSTFPRLTFIKYEGRKALLKKPDGTMFSYPKKYFLKNVTSASFFCREAFDDRYETELREREDANEKRFKYLYDTITESVDGDLLDELIKMVRMRSAPVG